jgi:hypothetical protein
VAVALAGVVLDERLHGVAAQLDDGDAVPGARRVLEHGVDTGGDGVLVGGAVADHADVDQRHGEHAAPADGVRVDVRDERHRDGRQRGGLGHAVAVDAPAESVLTPPAPVSATSWSKTHPATCCPSSAISGAPPGRA